MENLENTKNQLITVEQLTELTKAVYHFNYLTAFPIPDYMLEAWAKSISEIEPEITPEVVRWITNRMKTGHLTYNNRTGIQNVFDGFRVYILEKIKELKGKPDVEHWSALYRKYRVTPEPFGNGVAL